VAEPAGERDLKPVLGLFDVTMIVMGCIIGAGCFRTPSAIAQQVGSLGGILGVWSVGGVIALTGAIVFAELAAMFPRTGGQYVFVKEPFGRFPAFLFGWVLLAAIVSNAIAYVAGVFAEHMELLLTRAWGFGFAGLGHPSVPLLQACANLSDGHVVSDAEAGRKVVAFLLIIGFTWLNIRGLRLGATVQNIAMVAKIGGILTVIALGVVAFLRGDAFPADGAAVPVERGFGESFGAFSGAMFGAMFTYGGWQNVAAVGSEVRRPARTLPLGILLGTVGVVILYLSMNAALVAILGPGGVARSSTPTADAAGRVIAHGDLFVAALVMISTFAITQVLLMVTPRIYYAMARDGLFFRKVGTTHPRFGTPAIAIALQGAATIVHLLLGSMLDLLQLATLFDWLSFSACGLGLFLLRWRRPDAPRPYRAFGYPWLPGLFLLLSLWVFVAHLFEAEAAALKRGAVVFGLGLVLFFFFRRSQAAATGR
jgi:APA family basic amino acid/polyamine antiporter